jgi:hypothetical protein
MHKQAVGQKHSEATLKVGEVYLYRDTRSGQDASDAFFKGGKLPGALSLTANISQPNGIIIAPG